MQTLPVFNDSIPPVYSSGLAPTLVRLNDGSWDKLTFSLTVTNGDPGPIAGRRIRMLYGFSNTEIILLESVPTIIVPSGSYTITLTGDANGIDVHTSPEIEVLGDYLYMWFEVPDAFGNAVTLAVEAAQTLGSATVLFGDGTPNDNSVVASPGFFYYDISVQDGVGALYFSLPGGWSQTSVNFDVDQPPEEQLLFSYIPDDLNLSGYTAVTIDTSLLDLLVTSLEFPVAELYNGITVTGGAENIATLSFPALTVLQGGIQIESLPGLTSLQTPLLTNIQGGSLTLLSLPQLTSVPVAGMTEIGFLTLNECGVTSLDLASLVSVSTLSIANCNLIEDLNLSSLTTAGSIQVGNNSTLASIDLSSLTATSDGITIQNNAVLTSIDLGNPTLLEGGQYSFDTNALSEATVDAILQLFADSSAEGGTLLLHGGTNAAPSVAGNANVLVLEGRSWTVTTS